MAARIRIRNDLFQIQLWIRIRQKVQDLSDSGSGSTTLPATQINGRIRIHNPAPGSIPQPPVDPRGQPETQSPPEDRVGNKKPTQKNPKKPPKKTHKKVFFFLFCFNFFYENNTNFSL
jgi:hypothetical protein